MSNIFQPKWRFVRPSDLPGRSFADLLAWLEKLIQALFPNSGIEYWATSDPLRSEASKQPTPKSGQPSWVASALVGVCHGSSEGRRIEAFLRLRDGSMQAVGWAKSFGKPQECWSIARAVAEALEAIFLYEEQPEVVEMYDKLIKAAGAWHKLQSFGPVTVRRTVDRLEIIGPGNVVIDSRIFGGKPEGRTPYMDAYEADWLELLWIQGVKFNAVHAEPADRPAGVPA